jgi:hypothetical protein
VTLLPTEVPAFVRLQNPTDTDEARRQRLISQLHRAKFVNARQESYYEGARLVRDLGIAIPPFLRDLEAVAAWPEIVVDVIDERMEWRGWYTPDTDLGLEGVYRENHLDVESGQSVLDSLICGLAYMTVGTGAAGEPDVLVKGESPSRMTATWDARLRRAVDGLIELYDDDGRLYGWRVYEPDRTLTMERRNGRVTVTDIDQHNLGRVPIAVLLNRPRSSRVSGRSEITRAVRSLTDSGMRTLLGMEVAREFYGAPQRYLMGADESMFVDEDGRPVSQWAAIIGKMLMAPRDEDGNLPVPGAFQSASPQPFTDLLRTYSQMVSAASGVPATHLGFITDNPASADAIQRADMRLDKRAIRRQGQYNLGLVELGELAVLWRDGESPAPGLVQSLWVDPSTPTPAASADRAVKLIAAGVLPPDSDVTLEMLGFSDTEIARIKRDRLREAGRSAIATLGDAAAAVRTAQQPVIGAAQPIAGVVPGGAAEL